MLIWLAFVDAEESMADFCIVVGFCNARLGAEYAFIFVEFAMAMFDNVCLHATVDALIFHESAFFEVCPYE